VGNIAYHMLTNKTRAIVTDILFPSGYTSDDDNARNGDDRSSDDDEDTFYTSPLAAVANWADKVRYTSYFHWTAPLHFVDVQDEEIPGGCHVVNTKDGDIIFERALHHDTCSFIYERDCQNDNCAVGAIVNFSELASQFTPNGSAFNDDTAFTSGLARNAIVQIRPGLLRGSRQLISEPEFFSSSLEHSLISTHNVTQRQSLMFLIHIIGDIHQPLHVSRQSDKGGNTINVNFPSEFESYTDERNGHKHKDWDLHSVWDTGIIELAMKRHFASSQKSLEECIEAEYVTDDYIKKWSKCPNGQLIDCVSLWAREGFHYALNYAYENEDGVEVKDGDTLTEDYFVSRLEIVKRRLAAGGVRLAATLEDMFGDNEQF